MMDTRSGNYFSLLVICFCMLVLTSWMVWALLIDGEFYKPPVMYWGGCFAATKPTFVPGDPLTMRVIATKTRAIPGSVSWSLVNKNTLEVVANFEPRATVIGIGLNDVTVNIFEIPNRIPDGIYFARGMASYEVNVLRTIVYPLQSDTFWIKAKDVH
jgi:hypothetical protein